MKLGTQAKLILKKTKTLNELMSTQVHGGVLVEPSDKPKAQRVVVADPTIIEPPEYKLLP